MRRHAVTLALATAGLAAVLPTAQVYADTSTPTTRPAASAPRAADGGAQALATVTDAQQRAFWTEHEKNGTFRQFTGKMPDWKPTAEPPRAKEQGAGQAVKAPAVAPQQNGKSRFAAGSPGENLLRATTGRIRIAWPDEKDPNLWWVGACTGNVVTSYSKDVVATARHCIPHDDQGRVNSKATYEFTPGYSKDADGTEHAPYGKWTFRSVGVVSDSAGRQTSDTAFLALNTQNGTHVQDKVGASGYRFGTTSLPSRVVMAGIPANSNQFHTCVKEPYWGPDNPPQILGRGGPCTGDSDLSGGASGGPLLDGDTFDSGGPVQIGDFSGSLGDDAAAAVWRDEAFAVFRSVQGGGTGGGKLR
ncbi:trypsin-like serine protease [Streptomyces sp. NPDC001678]|uniref:trypsin-like serine protease n=1 Tax=Streptomyces sp. NPDC001678 TaxID=3364599 RepID=UPI0036B5961A